MWEPQFLQNSYEFKINGQDILFAAADSVRLEAKQIMLAYKKYAMFYKNITPALIYE
jgi:hypothetical protein